MKILLIADLDHFDQLNRISDNRSKFLHYLATTYPESITLIGRATDLHFYKGIEIKSLIQQLDSSFDLIIHYILGPGAGSLQSQLMVSGLEGLLEIKKCLWIEDIQYTLAYLILIQQYRFQIVMLQYRNLKIIQQFIRGNRELIVCCLEQFIDSKIYNYQPNVTKINDILCYGYIDTCYPLRTRMFNLLQQHSDQFRVKFIKHPGYHQLEKVEKTTIGIDLATEINQSWICLCTKSSYDLFLKKYLEASFCGTIICGDIPSDYRSLLQNKIVEINMSMSDQEILNILHQTLQEKEIWQEKAIELSNLLQSKYNHQAGGKYFIEIVQKLLVMRK